MDDENDNWEDGHGIDHDHDEDSSEFDADEEATEGYTSTGIFPE